MAESKTLIEENETINLLMSHVSVRSFLDQPVETSTLATIVRAGQMASTSSGVQAYSVISVEDKALRSKLRELSGNQAYVEECPVFLVWCADLHRLELAAGPHLGDGESYADSTENFVVATVDVALASQNAAVAAEALGLGIVYIGGLRNHIAEVAELLGLPERVYPVFGMCIGYPAERNGLRPRLPLEAVLHTDRYDASKQAEAVALYDAVSAEYLSKRTNGARSTPWSKLMAGRLAEPVRLHMQTFLQGKGFMKR